MQYQKEVRKGAEDNEGRKKKRTDREKDDQREERRERREWKGFVKQMKR